MTEGGWLSVTSDERRVLQEVLSAYLGAKGVDARVEALKAKLAMAESYPQITIGVYGGLVQWVMGNPFPIRICDYDGEKDDLPDIDERNQRCTMWFESPDTDNEAAQLSTSAKPVKRRGRQDAEDR